MQSRECFNAMAIRGDKTIFTERTEIPRFSFCTHGYLLKMYIAQSIHERFRKDVPYTVFHTHRIRLDVLRRVEIIVTSRVRAKARSGRNQRRLVYIIMIVCG